ICSLLDGNLSLESELDVGSVFTVTVPMKAGNYVAETEIDMIKKIDGDYLFSKWYNTAKEIPGMTKVLINGLKGLPEMVDSFAKALQDRDYQAITFLSHKLKGLSGNLQMTEIYNIASLFDNSLKNSSDDYIKTSTKFIAEFKEIVDELPDNLDNFDSEKSRLFKQDLKILQAEDNSINSEFVKTLLNNMNLDCDIAENGKIALEMLHKKKYDLLLLDMQMPIMDGMEAIKIIRETDSLKDIHVIALTAHSFASDSKQILAAGCNNMLSKPIKIEIFNKLVREQQYKKTINIFDSEDESTVVKKKKPEFSQEDIQKLKELLIDLESNVNRFDSDKIKHISFQLKKMKKKKITSIAKDLVEIADDYDTQFLNDIIIVLKNMITENERLVKNNMEQI
ncbi:MAG: response regulator, partial [Candidatus Cloacimonadota bacterium]|nr:response regulator [Candidatus Cloacimonadota bacterium]